MTMMSLPEAVKYLQPIADSADPTMRYGEALHVVLAAVDIDYSENRVRDAEIAELKAQLSQPVPGGLPGLTDGEAESFHEALREMRSVPSGDDREALVSQVEAYAQREGLSPRGVIQAAIRLTAEALSLPVPAEDQWEYAEFDADELQADGTIHEWAEPRDRWADPLPADELATLRDEGQVYARRPKPAWWVPVKGTEK